MISHRVSLLMGMALLLALCAPGTAQTLEGEKSADTVPPAGLLTLSYTLTVPEGEPAIKNVRLQMPVSSSVTVNEATGRGPALVTHICYAWWEDFVTGEPRETSTSLTVRWPAVLLTPTVDPDKVTLVLPTTLESGESASLTVTVERAPEP